MYTELNRFASGPTEVLGDGRNGFELEGNRAPVQNCYTFKSNLAAKFELIWQILYVLVICTVVVVVNDKLRYHNKISIWISTIFG